MRTFAGYFTVQRRLGQEATAPRSPILKPVRRENAVLDWVEGATLNDPKERNKLRTDMIQAGYTSPTAPVLFVIIRFLLAIGLPLGFMFLQILSAKPMTGLALIFISLILCAVGFLGPRIFIDSRANSLRTQLEIEFPDALDLMVVCVEAGLGLEAAFVRVGTETRRSHPRI